MADHEPAGTPPAEDEMSAARVAQRLGLSERRVRQLREAGKLAGLQIDSKWWFSAASVAAYEESRPAADR